METQLNAIIQQAFPQRHDLQISKFEKINAGWECEIFSFHTAFTLEATGEKSEQDLILRVFPRDAAQKAEGELAALRVMMKANYPVPTVYASGAGETLDGRPFMVMEKIEGQTMWPMLHNILRHRALIQTFCRLFARLHAVDWRALVPDAEQYEPHSPTEMIDKLLESFMPVISALPLPGFSPVLDWLQAHKTEAGSLRASCTHWDFHPNNILVCKDRSAYVIDWTGAQITDYRFDLAWTLLLVMSYEGNTWRNEILRGYEREAGAKVEYLEFFDVVACVRRLYSTIASIRYGAEKLGMRPGAEQEMLKQKSAMRRVYDLMVNRAGIRVKEVEEVLAE